MPTAMPISKMPWGSGTASPVKTICITNRVIASLVKHDSACPQDWISAQRLKPWWRG